MICPHCSASLLRRERTGNRCSTCRRRFALDPKTNLLQLSDLRVQRLVAKLTGDGAVTCTVTQLWYMASRKSFREAGAGCGGRGCSIVGLLIVAAAWTAGIAGGSGSRWLLVVGVVVLVGTIAMVGRRFSRPPYRMVMPLETFRKKVIRQWLKVYGTLPAGVVDDVHVYETAPAAGARAALLCPDRSVVTFLAANNVPRRFGLVLATDIAQIPDGVPVVALHDASAEGCLLAWRARAALPGRRVVDAGVPPRAVLAARPSGKGIVMRLRRPTDQERGELQWLHGAGALTAQELDWLVKGWSSPLAAVPPLKLLTALAWTVERLALGGDDEERRAEDLGFLSWPGERTA